MSGSLQLSSDKDAKIAALEALLIERDMALAKAKAELLHRDLLIETMRAARAVAADAVRGIVGEAVPRD